MAESLKEDGRPAQQWYWDDWFSEFGLRLCSLAARGLWMDMLGIMFKAEIRGTLTVNGRQINSKSLAKICNTSEANISKYLDELEEQEVFSRLEDKTIINRRMFSESNRKEEISKIRSEAGKRGAKKRWQADGKPDSKKMAKMASSTPSSTPTSSSSSKNITEKTFDTLWKDWPKEGRFLRDHCFMKFNVLVKAGKLGEFKETTIGYFEYLKSRKIHDNFDQKTMHLKTWMNNWEGEKETYTGFKHKSPL